MAPYNITARIAFTRWWNFIPLNIRHLFKKNESENYIKYPSGQTVWFKSGEKPDTLFGEDVYSVVLDEASRMRFQVWEAVVSVLTATGGKAKIIGNVEDTSKWFYRLSHTAKERGEGYHKLLTSDNPFVSSDVIAHAKSILPDPIFNALYMAVPTDQYSSYRIILSNDVYAIKTDLIEVKNPVYVGIDIGLGAPDVTSIWCANEQNEIWKEAEISVYDEMRQIDALYPIIQRVAALEGVISFDIGGIGHGIVDRLKELFSDSVIKGINFGSAASDKNKFKNKRAEMYWNARQFIQGKKGKIQIEDSLMEEIESTFYMPEENKIRIESKVDIKERLGRSPNDLDAFVLLIQSIIVGRSPTGVRWL